MQNQQQARARRAGQGRRDRVHDTLQRRGTPLVAAGQPRNLLGECRLRAGRVLAVQPPHLQIYAQGPATDGLVENVAHVGAVHSL